MRRRTKIVATIGPSCSDQDLISSLIRTGIDVARLNFSHSDHETHARTIRWIRQEAARQGRTVGVLCDLQGPKIRVGQFSAPPRQLARGDTITFAVNRAPSGDELPTDHDKLDQDVRKGDPLLIDDGTIETQVIAVAPGVVRCKVLTSGILHQRKGINLPASIVSTDALTAKDREDALFAAENNADLIALSFVRRPEDIVELASHLTDHGHDVPIVAKIEKPQALTNLEQIIAHCWGVMVARGDLGVELLPEDVPMAQKRIIQAANRHAKPVITATQMLDSMRTSPRPTRAEASDVANAVLDGSDAVMLSGETATGQFPIESVAMMGRIICAIEGTRQPEPLTRRRERGKDTVPESVADACCHVAYYQQAKAIVTVTRTGATAQLVARLRPYAPIIAFSEDASTRHRLASCWGVLPVPIAQSSSVDDRVPLLDEQLIKLGLANTGDLIVICMGSPSASPGATNVIMVHRVGDAATNIDLTEAT